MSNFKDIARIGRDAEVRHTPNNVAVANFPAAIDVGFGDKKTTLWLDCAMFGKRAESGLVQYLVKGAQVMIEGNIDLRQYTKGDGTPGAAVTLNVQDLKLVGGKSDRPAQSQPERPAASQQTQQDYQGHSGSNQPNPTTQAAGGYPEQVDDFDDDIPF